MESGALLIGRGFFVRKLIFLAAAAGAVLLAAPSGAALTLVADCNAGPADILGGYGQTCAGYYAGNLVNNARSADQIAALDTLGFDTTGFDYNSFIKLESLDGSGVIDFGESLSGITYLAVHYGGGRPGPAPGNNVTAFYRIDLGTTSVESLRLQFGASSNAILYGSTATMTPVPEPATWAMMLGGFGLLGATLRRRHKVHGVLA